MGQHSKFWPVTGVSWARNAAFQVDNAAIEAMINELEAHQAGELSLDEFVAGWSEAFPSDTGQVGLLIHHTAHHILKESDKRVIRE